MAEAYVHLDGEDSAPTLSACCQLRVLLLFVSACPLDRSDVFAIGGGFVRAARVKSGCNGDVESELGPSTIG